MESKLNPAAELYMPSSLSNIANLELTTHLGIGAHQDDLEIIAIQGILAAYDHPDKYFTGVIVNDGRGAPRSGPYADISDDALWETRCEEQRKAARLGNYHAQYLLNHPSQVVKSSACKIVIDDLKHIIQSTSPEIIYTHNLFDKHDTHVAVALCVIQALRELKPLPNFIKIYGCEAWRGLDWLLDDDKVTMDVSKHPELQETLLTVFESQIIAGKRYDLAAIGRRQANATFYQSHETDQSTHMVYAMDLTPLIHHPEMQINHFVSKYINHLSDDVRGRLNRLRKDSV
jgi:LmbE family N-acetylglucosaminyl deacetylase